jgi:RNA recognition motif-containing protein
MARRLFVENLPRDMSVSDLEKLFAQFGKVESTIIYKHSPDDTAKGHGYVDMQNANDAIANLNGMLVKGCELRVRPARSGVKRRKVDRKVRGRTR